MVVLSPLRVACRSRALVLRGAIRGRLVHSSASPPLTSLRAVGADASLPRPLGAALARRTGVSSRAPLPFATTTSVRSRSTLIPSAVADDAFRATSTRTMTEELAHAVDRYGGVIVDQETLPETTEAFTAALQASIEAWIERGVRGVWLKIPLERADLVGPAARACGFRFHHAEPAYVMLTRWLPEDEPDMLPPNASHQVGIGAFVQNGEGKTLLVQERRGPAAAAARPDFWKLPTGLVEQGEDIPAAAVREVLEETGVKTEFVSILGIRHGHGVAFGKSDMFFLVSLRIADGESAHEVRVQEQELAAAEWRDLADASHSEYILEGSHMDHMYGLCVAHAEGRYAGMGWQALPAGFNRDGTVVTYSNDPSPDTLAKGRR